MRIVLNKQEYDIQAGGNSLTSSMEALLPLTLKLSHSADHEYYASLPQSVDAAGVESTSYVKAGWVYYFKDWNAFALNFKETDIAPYKVSVIGEVSGGIENVLACCGANIEIEIKK